MSGAGRPATFSGHLVYPERASRIAPRTLARASRCMVAAAHPLATRAGLQALEEGGTAADAAVAAAFVLGVVEPQSSGIGGGGYALAFEADGGLFGYDGRETAPSAATRDLFQVDGEALEPERAAVSGRSIGVPRLVPMLRALHGRHGRLPWPRVVEPAILLARDGFEAGERLNVLVAAALPRLHDPVLRSLWLDPSGTPLPAGARIRNPDLAEVLRLIARDGPSALRTGEVAREIVRAARAAPHGGSPLDLADLEGADHSPARVVAASYRGHRVCGLAGSTAGGPSLLQMLALLERFDLASVDPASAAAAHLLADAGGLAFADRFAHLGDTPEGRAAADALLDPAYLDARGRALSPERSALPAAPGALPGEAGPDARPAVDGPSTTHLSVVDGEGRAVALTQSIGLSFGAMVAPCGIILNDQLVAFSPPSGRPGRNDPAPGRRPLSSMAPTLAFRPDGSLRLVVGSPGSSAIVGYVLKTVVGVLDWGLDVQAAAALPNVLNRNGPTELEAGTPAEGLAGDLEALGHRTLAVPLTSGIHAVELRGPGEVHGAADPRREGEAAGI